MSIEKVRPYHPVNSARYRQHRPGAWTPRSKAALHPSQSHTWSEDIVTPVRERWSPPPYIGEGRHKCQPFLPTCSLHLKKKIKLVRVELHGLSKTLPSTQAFSSRSHDLARNCVHSVTSRHRVEWAGGERLGTRLSKTDTHRVQAFAGFSFLGMRRLGTLIYFSTPSLFGIQVHCFPTNEVVRAQHERQRPRIEPPTFKAV